MAGNSSIIDALVVTLGLNATNFEQGINKAGSGIVDLTRRLAAMFIAVRSIEDVVGYFKDLSETLFHLGIDARNLGVAATALSRWGEVAKLSGGNAQDAAATIGGLQQAIFGLRFQGQMSGSLQMLQRFGVAYLDNAGKMRNFKDIAMDAATALQKSGLDRAMRFQVAQAMGFQGGMASAVASGPAALAKELKEAGTDQKSLTQKAIDSQVALQQSIIRLNSTVMANSSALLHAVTPALGFMVSELHDLAVLISALTHPGKLLEDTFVKTFGPGSTLDKLPGMKYLNEFGEWIGQHVPVGAATPGEARGLRNNNPTNLKAVGNEARDAQGFAVFANMAQGLAAARDQLYRYARRGINTIRGIVTKWAPAADGNQTAKYIDFVSKALGKSPDAPLSPADYPALLAAMSRMEDGAGAPGRAAVGKLLAPPAPGAGAALAASGAPASPALARPSGATASGPAAAGGTQVSIGTMNVNTKATNAGGIAADINGALQRKIYVSNSDVGLA